MIQKVIITNHLNEIFELPLSTPEQSGFVVTSISGLNPPKATINFTESSVLDGGYYNSARVSKRNIRFSLKFLKNLSIEECRHRSYRIFPIKKKVTMTFVTDERLLTTEGYVEANEAVIFSKTTSTSISVLCPSPYFESLIEYENEFGTISPSFEFPFSNESTSLPLIEFGTYSYDHELTVEYPGEIEVGGIFEINCTGAVEDITIGDEKGNMMTIDTSRIYDNTGTALGSGDTIVINTIAGKKNIYLRRSGVEIPIFYCIDRHFDWIELYPGDNTIHYNAASGIDNMLIKLTYPIYYQGI